MRILLFSFSLLLLLLASVHAQNGEPFYARDFAQINQGKKLLYTDVKSFVGSFSNDVSTPKYVYVWVKTAVNEVGVRVLAPASNVPQGALTDNSNVASFLGKAFDPAVHFQSPSTPVTTTDALRQVTPKTEFVTLFQNDNDETLNAQPNGKKLNAQVFPAATAPVIQGLFRVRVDNMDHKKGAYLLQIGNLMQGNVIIANDLPALIKQINN